MWRQGKAAAVATAAKSSGKGNSSGVAVPPKRPEPRFQSSCGGAARRGVAAAATKRRSSRQASAESVLPATPEVQEVWLPAPRCSHTRRPGRHVTDYLVRGKPPDTTWRRCHCCCRLLLFIPFFCSLSRPRSRPRVSVLKNQSFWSLRRHLRAAKKLPGNDFLPFFSITMNISIFFLDN